MCTKYEANKYVSLYIPTGCFDLGFLNFFFSLSLRLKLASHIYSSGNADVCVKWTLSLFM